MLYLWVRSPDPNDVLREKLAGNGVLVLPGTTCASMRSAGRSPPPPR